MDDFYSFVKSAWVVWMMALFVGIVVWVLWPSNRRRFRKASQIPFENDAPCEPRDTTNRKA